MEGWTQKRIGDLFDVKAGGDLQEANYSPCPTAEAQWPIYANSLENKGLYGYTSKPRFSGNAVTITGRGILVMLSFGQMILMQSSDYLCYYPK